MKELHPDLYEKEQRYWWSVIQRSAALSAWDRYSDPKLQNRILDVGCGAGAFLYDLQERSVLGQQLRVYGIDFSIQACQYSKSKKIDVLQADVCYLPLRDDCLGVIFALNLIEHIEDEVTALKQLYRVCSRGGVSILIVPAWTCLWGGRDNWLGHKRRYTVAKLKASLEEAGFKVIRCSYVHILLFPILYLMNKIKQFLRYNKIKTEIFTVPRPLNSLLIYLFTLELKLSSWVSFPMGTSIVCVAKKCQ